MRISDVLDRKGREVVTVSPDRSVHEAMQVLVGNNVGSVIVVEGERPVGILTERDVLRLGAANPGALESTSVADAMTRDLVVAMPGDLVDYAAGIMTSNRIRHLPIIDGDRLAGVLSIGDVVKAIKQEQEVENRYLRDYIQGTVR